ncbi:hypothetical protein EIP91_005291 [Steccherinum ochraceum]|uniref:Uncharacterized protein n=1 Tax=Steccherinum ochraceum TaxID=92696 RepID=A0A4R0RDG4_9APHY|nr:hypothetical protein EIP91_005291 [Steccherinum ochraceum]
MPNDVCKTFAYVMSQDVARLVNASNVRKLSESRARCKRLRKELDSYTSQSWTDVEGAVSVVSHQDTREINDMRKKIKENAEELLTLRAQLQDKTSALERERESNIQLNMTLRSTRKYLIEVTGQLHATQTRFHSYQADRRLSASYEADLEEKLSCSSRHCQALTADLAKLQQEHSLLQGDYRACCDRLAIAEDFAGLDAVFTPKPAVVGDALLLVNANPSFNHVQATDLSGNGPRLQVLESYSDHGAHAGTAQSTSGSTLDKTLPVELNDALDAYSEAQEASFTYEAFLLEKNEEDRVELEALRRSNESLVADFADLLASYKDLIRELRAANSLCLTQRLGLTDSCLRTSGDYIPDRTLATRI